MMYINCRKSLGVFGSLGLALLSADAARADMIDDNPSLVSYWKLNEPAGTTGAGTVIDAKAGRNGTPAGDVVFGSVGPAPLAGTSATFDGVNDIISVPYDAALAPTSFTIEAFARPTGGAGAFRSVMTLRGAPQQGYIFYAQQANTWAFWTGRGNGYDALSSASVVLNQWQHLAGTFEVTNSTPNANGAFSGTKTFFLNGMPAASTTAQFYRPLTSPANNLSIGSGGDVGTEFRMVGDVDQVAVFNESLTHQTIADQYNSFSSYAMAVKASAPVGYWRMGEQAGTTAFNSMSVGALPGAYTNGPVLRQYDANAGNSAIRDDLDTAVDFDGSNDHVRIATDPALRATSFTIEAWVRPEGGAGAFRSVVTSREGGAASKGYILYAGSTNRWEFWTGNNTGSWDSDITSANVVLNQWTHVAAVFEATAGPDANGLLTGTKRFFVDGVQVLNLTGQQYLPTTESTPRDFFIGIGNDTGTQFPFNGKIDEVAFYGTALSAADIAAHYTASGVPEPGALGLVGAGAAALLMRRRRRCV